MEENSNLSYVQATKQREFVDNTAAFGSNHHGAGIAGGNTRRPTLDLSIGGLQHADFGMTQADTPRQLKASSCSLLWSTCIAARR